MSGSHLTKEFYDLVKAIGESKSKQEEDSIIEREKKRLKAKIGDGSLVKKRLKEFLVRLVYVEMLGHDASFGYIKAVELTASSNIVHKKTGYLTCALCLSPDHDFRFMLINQLQRDLHSTNHLEISAALAATARLCTANMIPAVLNDVVRLLGHENEVVRKKAVMTVQQCYRTDPDSVVHLTDTLRRALCDRDPSVMGAALCALHSFIEVNPVPFKDLVPSFVSILKQVTEHRLPREYDYHRVPAPWIQMRLLRILALLGRADQAASEGMYEIILNVMQRADTGINVAYAIVYDCVKCITTIYPNTTLLEAAAVSISRFITAPNHNLKYLGVTGLATIVKDHPRYAANHQMAVIDCLEDPDETLKRKTLELLYSMTNPVNVEFITEKLLTYLESTSDDFLKTDLVTRITACAERFAPSNVWYVITITRLFEVAGGIVRPEVAHGLMSLIAEGTGEDEDADDDLRIEAVERYAEIVGKPNLPELLVQLAAWVLGEYGVRIESLTVDELMNRLAALGIRPELSAASRGFVVTSLMKLTAQSGSCPGSVRAFIEQLSSSRDVDLQERCLEFLSLVDKASVMVQVLPVDASCEEMDVDENLAFLNDFVDAAKQMGALPYDPPETIMAATATPAEKAETTGLRYTAYAAPAVAAAQNAAPAESLAAPDKEGPPPSPADPQGQAGLDSGLNLRGVQRRWGRRPEPEPAAAPPAASPAPAATTAPPAASPAPPAATVAAPPRAATPEPEEPREPSERERMAAALFGGVPSAEQPGPAPRGRAPRSTRARKSAGAQGPANGDADGAGSGSGAEATEDLLGVGSPAAEDAAATPVVDLLDMGSAPPAPAAAPPVDLLGDLTLEPVLAPSPTPAVGPDPVPAAAAAAVPPAAAEGDDSDVFAGLMAPAADAALPPLVPGSLVHGAARPFAYNGLTMEPLRLSTDEYGSRWQQLAATSKEKVAAPATRDVDAMADRMTLGTGAALVEKVPNTMEVIAAGQLGSGAAARTVLLHGWAQPQQGAVVLTVKAVDKGLAEAVQQYLQRRFA